MNNVFHPTFENMTFDAFKKALSSMSEEDLAAFINFAFETRTDEMLLPLFRTKFGDIDYVSRFTEDGNFYDEDSKRFYNELDKMAKLGYSFAHIDANNDITFLREMNALKYYVISLRFTKELFNDKFSWAFPFNPTNGISNDLYVMFIESVTIDLNQYESNKIYKHTL